MTTNTTHSGGQDLGIAQLSSLSWLEPTIIVICMAVSLIMNRRRNYRIFPQRSAGPQYHSNLGASSRESEETLVEPEEYDFGSGNGDDALLLRPASDSPKRDNRVRPAWSSCRFGNNIHSRLLHKFPFLIEMFYWILNYAAYRISKFCAASFHRRKGNALVVLAQQHGIDILNLEHNSVFSFLFPVKEITVQQYFLRDHVALLTALNQFYSLVHISGTVAFICWYYYAATSFDEFAIARRTMTLGNFVAFLVFAIYPCMPPRLLPESFGFEDTVRQAHAESVWVGEDGNSGAFNQLAAMPSLHFTYALVVGSTIFWHSGCLQSLCGQPREHNIFGMFALMFAGICYPVFVLLVIVATANHYYLDAVMATFSAVFCFLCNRIWLLLLPPERLLARILRVEKPVPTTGEERRRHNGESNRDKTNTA